MGTDPRKIGRLFVWGFEGTKVSPSLKRFFQKYPPAGVILFKRNLESPKQIRELTKGLRSISGNLLIGIDQEGGRVSRLPEPFTQLPPAAVWGKIYEMEKDPKVIFRVGQYLAQELLSVGINTDFAPVLDVNSNPKNPIIGDRAFSEDPKIAAQAAIAFYLGMKREGVIACGKHFPGHGDTKTDSHLTLPRVTKDLRSLQRVELFPFREAVKKAMPMLMTAHVVYDAWDKRNPATLSRVILQDLLRKKMRYRGVVISDDLLMKAVSKKYSPVEASLLALRAGVDLLLICRDEEKGGEVIEKVAREAASDPYLLRRIEESFRRVADLKRRYLRAPN